MDITDLEKNKFSLENWKVALDTSSELYWSDDVSMDIADLEKNKFDGNTIRTVTSF